jgi:hypothetical protein
MNKQLYLSLTCLSLLILVVISCEKDFKADNKPAPPPVVSLSYKESFDTVGNISKKGWVIINNSNPVGPSAWRQGRFEYGGKLGDEVVGFPAYSGTFNQNEYVSVDMNCGQGASFLSAWLISPPTDMKNGDQFTFYTRTKGDYADRMQVWINTKTSNAFVGKAAVDTGDFSPKLLDINPGMGADYPAEWTKYTITLSGITGTKKGRIAFRYYIEDGGPGGSYGDQIGIDDFEFISK